MISVLVVSESGEVQFTDPEKRRYHGTLRGGKLALQDGAGKLVVEVSFSAEKVKATVGDRVYELKVSEDKIKVRLGEESYGKVKYYPDTGKVKAKDDEENTVIESKSFDRNTGALGAFLIPDISADLQTFLCLLLIANRW